MAVLRTAYVKVKPDTDGFDGELTRRLRRIDARKAGQSLGQTLGSGMAKGFSAQGTAFAKTVAASAGRLTLLTASASSAAPAVANLGAALAPAAGALVALPAALGAVKVASGVFKVAVMGVGEAVQAGLSGTAEQAKKALEELPPAARTFARSIIDLKPQLEGLRAAVSGRFFAPLQNDVTPLAEKYLPLLKTQMGDVAAQLGGLGNKFARAAGQARVFNAVKALFAGTSGALAQLRGAVTPVTNAFADLIAATAPMLPRIADGLADAATKASTFVSAAAKSGRIKEVFNNAITTIKDLGAILGNVGGIIKTVFSASGVDGGGLLTNLRELTGQVEAFLKAGEGNTALTSIFSTLSTLGQSMRTALGAVLPAIAQSVSVLAPAISGLAPAFAGLVAAVAPLLPYFTQIAATALTALIPAVSALSGWLTENRDVLKGVVITLGVAYGAIQLYTAGVKIHAAATAISATVQKLWNSTFVLRLRVLALDAAAMARSTAATVAGTIAQTASRVATIAGTAVTWLAAAATTALGVAWRFLTGPIGLAITAITLITGAIIYLWKNNETFRTVVLRVWAAIKSAISAVGAWFTGTLWPSLQRAYSQLASGFVWMRDKVVGAFRAVRDGIQNAYGFIRDKVFAPLRDFITKTIPDAFRSGTAAIGKIWDGLQELAKKPVRFVVEQVINGGIIGAFNQVSGFFGGPKVSPISLPRGFGDGHGHAGPAKKRTGDGFGDIADFVSGPANWVKGKVGGLIGRIGDHPFARMLKGMAGKLVGSLVDKAKGLLGASEYGGQSSGVGGLQAGISGVLGALRGAFGSVPLISGLRPGATTLSGNTSYHASGRAIDIAPIRGWAEFIHGVFGPRLRELITPWQDLNLLNGRPHTFRGAVWNQHNFAGGNAHIHAALDDGGFRTLRPGYNVIPNWTGMPEPIAGPNAMAALAGGNTYQITINVPPTAHPAEVGKAVVGVIQAYEQTNGKRWRQEKKP
ncbi:hypothetical protein Q0Z83_060110 [Actinoplanes sichuanensis]|uniref:Phage-related protein n=1 Tax=Actinoplanes sichuanensis TaxID=512349 RepID=A0ABW4A653_9ACTN|nr:hypothetical protein [Actinoplanes sichuanensis]BEL07820.1 hypothetical protein Q0Z83_060110 [Actinoplanes sichuanensis]